MHCMRCGAMMNPGEAFCGKCGASLSVPQTTVAERYDSQTPAPTQAQAASRRTPGMAAVGVLNIIFGCFVTLSGLSLFVAATMDKYRRLEYARFQTFFLAWVVIGLCGIVAGWGILKLSSWATAMSLLIGGVGIPLFVFPIVKEIAWLWQYWSEVNSWSARRVMMIGLLLCLVLGSLAYLVVLIVLFQKRSWKQTFSASS